MFGKNSSAVWNLIPSCLMWTICRERNSHTFKDIEGSVGKIIEIFIGSLYDWSRTWALTSFVGEFLESFVLENFAHSL